MAIDASTGTAWATDWYRSAQFGGLQTGTGLLIDIGRRVMLASVQITLGTVSGADLQLLAGNVPELAKMRLAASATGAGGTVRLRLIRRERARYLLYVVHPAAAGRTGDLPGQDLQREAQGTP